ncbi:MAG: phosphoglycerate kinase, partial [Candidatus Omnitrophica bacterium]|nr:phosphoglycerate kinase [Candidatus Omnitrophota bacterium]
MYKTLFQRKKDKEELSADDKALMKEVDLTIVRPLGAKMIMRNMNKLGLDALITAGGDDTCGAAAKLRAAYERFPVIALPKTMDNDIKGIPISYGFDSFVQAATDEARRLQERSAPSLHRVMVHESFGRKAGFVQLGIGSNIRALRTLIPEEGPVDLQALIEALEYQAMHDPDFSGVIEASEGLVLEETKDNAYLFSRAWKRSPVAREAFQREDIERDNFGNRKLKDAGRILAAVLNAAFKERGSGITVSLVGKSDYATREADTSPFDLWMTKKLGESAIEKLFDGVDNVILYVDEQGTVKELPLQQELTGRRADIHGVQKEQYMAANTLLFPDYMPPVKIPAIDILAQRVTTKQGAQTGEVYLNEALEDGARGIIAGHSEARDNFKRESDTRINEQVKAAAENQNVQTIILCVGETLKEKDAEKSISVIQKQLQLGLKGVTPEQVAQKIVIAYEPRWAIGGSGLGKPATAQDAQEMAAYVRGQLADMFGRAVADVVRIQYGGSANKDNAREYLSQPDVDGLLVGSKSTSVQEFLPIIDVAAAVGPKNGRVPYIGANWKTYPITSEYYEFAGELQFVDHSRVQVGIAPSLNRIEKVTKTMAIVTKIIEKSPGETETGDPLKIAKVTPSVTTTLGAKTIRLDIELVGGAKGHFVVPAGTSTGEDEAKTVGVEQAIKNIQALHAEVTRRGLRADQLVEIADVMRQMSEEINKTDPEKRGLGAEVTLSYQMACAWAAASQKGLEPYEFIRELAPDIASKGVPRTKIQYNITNGGEHAENSLDMQEFMIVPVGATTADANRMCDEIDKQLGLIYQQLGLAADPYDKGVGALRGKEGGYKVEDLTKEKLAEIYDNVATYDTIDNLYLVDLKEQNIGVHEFVLNCMLAAIKNAGYEPSTSGEVGTVSFAFDPAVSEMVVDKDKPDHDPGLYWYEGNKITSEQLADIFASWAEKYPVDSVEDGMSQNDWNGWIHLIEKTGDKIMLIGDDNLVTQAGRLTKLIQLLDEKGFIGPDGKVTKKLGILIKLNQNGYLTTGINDPSKGYLGTLEVIRLAKKFGIEVIISHRSKEAEPEENEVSIAEVAAAVNAYALKSGDHVQGIRAVKEDRLAAIDARERVKVSGEAEKAKTAGIYDAIPTIDEIPAEKKVVFLRLDLNGVDSPYHDRVQKSLPTLRKAMEGGRTVIIATHNHRYANMIAENSIETKSVESIMLDVAAAYYKEYGEVLPFNLQRRSIKENGVDKREIKIVKGAANFLENTRYCKYDEVKVNELMIKVAKKETLTPEEAAGLEGYQDYANALASIAYDAAKELYPEVENPETLVCHVNEAFSCNHRFNASVYGLIEHFDSIFIGNLVKKELDVFLGIDELYGAMLGGAKLDEKVQILENLGPKFVPEKSVVGIAGAAIPAFMKAQHGIDLSTVMDLDEKERKAFDEDVKNAETLMQMANEREITLITPTAVTICNKKLDPKRHIAAKTMPDGAEVRKQVLIDDLRKLVEAGEEWYVYDAHPAFIDEFLVLLEKRIPAGGNVIYNGNPGVSELEPFAISTKYFSSKLKGLQEKGIKVNAGGGDTGKTVNEADVEHKSTGGGASGMLLVKGKLPVLDAILQRLGLVKGEATKWFAAEPVVSWAQQFLTPDEQREKMDAVKDFLRTLQITYYYYTGREELVVIEEDTKEDGKSFNDLIRVIRKKREKKPILVRLHEDNVDFIGLLKQVRVGVIDWQKEQPMYADENQSVIKAIDDQMEAFEKAATARTRETRPIVKKISTGMLLIAATPVVSWAQQFLTPTEQEAHMKAVLEFVEKLQYSVLTPKADTLFNILKKGDRVDSEVDFEKARPLTLTIPRSSIDFIGVLFTVEKLLQNLVDANTGNREANQEVLGIVQGNIEKFEAMAELTIQASVEETEDVAEALLLSKALEKGLVNTQWIVNQVDARTPVGLMIEQIANERKMHFLNPGDVYIEDATKLVKGDDPQQWQVSNIREKMAAGVKIAVLRIGETLKDKLARNTERVIAEQLGHGLAGLTETEKGKVVIVYTPPQEVDKKEIPDFDTMIRILFKINVFSDADFPVRDQWELNVVNNVKIFVETKDGYNAQMPAKEGDAGTWLAAESPEMQDEILKAKATNEPLADDEHPPIYYFGNYPVHYDQFLPKGTAGMTSLLGGKGGNIAEMINDFPGEFKEWAKEQPKYTEVADKVSLDVPPGFTITTEQTKSWISAGEKVSEEFKTSSLEALSRLEQVMGRKLGAIDEGMPLLVAVRSGAEKSMPGMMDTVLNLGLNDDSVSTLAEATNEWFAWDCYRRFFEMYGTTVLGIEDNDAEKIGFKYILETILEKRGIKSEYGLSAEDLEELVGLYKAFILEQGHAAIPYDPYEQYLNAIDAVFRSNYNERALAYRAQQGYKLEDTLTAVSVQAMVYGNMNDKSGAGVGFSRDNTTGKPGLVIEYNNKCQGEDVVKGRVAGLPLDNLKKISPDMALNFEAIAEFLEMKYGDLQDMEFTFQYDDETETVKFWMLQTRSAKRTSWAEFVVAYDLVQQGLITEQQAVERISPAKIAELLAPLFDKADKKKAEEEGRLLSDGGLNASPGAGVGHIVFDNKRAIEIASRVGIIRGKIWEGLAVTPEDREFAKYDVILVRDETSPDDLPGMLKSAGFLTKRGGRTSHAALVARQFGKPAVVGDDNLSIDYAAKTLTIIDPVTGEIKKVLNELDVISIDGFGERDKGQFFEGAIKTIPSRLNLAKLVEGIPELERVIALLKTWIETLPDTAKNNALREEYIKRVEQYTASIKDREKIKENELTEEDHKFVTKYEAVQSWAGVLREDNNGLGVRANAENPLDVLTALVHGAEGIGLARTEHMFMDAERIPRIQQMILSGEAGQADRQAYKDALAEILPFQQVDFEQIFMFLNGKPATIRLLDPPLHEFLPHEAGQLKKLAAFEGVSVEEIINRIEELAAQDETDGKDGDDRNPLVKDYAEAVKKMRTLTANLNLSVDEVVRRIDTYAQENPMFGTRGVRLSVIIPEIIEVQAEAIFGALRHVQSTGIEVNAEIMVPLVGNAKEYIFARDIIETIAEKHNLKRDEYMIGTMIELVAGTINVGDIARAGAEFLSFGTNDLTQGTMKLSRDDGKNWINNMMLIGAFGADPFSSLDPAVGAFVKRTIQEARAVNPGIKIGICGEQGVDIASMRNYLAKYGITYVSGGSLRLAAALITSAQESLEGHVPLEGKVAELPTPDKSTSLEAMDVAVRVATPDEVNALDKPPSMITVEKALLNSLRLPVQLFLLTQDEREKRDYLEEFQVELVSFFEEMITDDMSVLPVRFPDIALQTIFEYTSVEETNAALGVLSDALNVDKKEVERRIDNFRELNRAIGTRGIRGYFIESLYPLYNWFVVAVLEAAENAGMDEVDIILPFITNAKELDAVLNGGKDEEGKKIVPSLKKDIIRHFRADEMIVKIGAIIETPAAVVNAKEIGEMADFVIIETTKLTEGVWAAFEGDAKLPNGFFEAYRKAGIWDKDIFKFAPDDTKFLIAEAIRDLLEINQKDIRVVLNPADQSLIDLIAHLDVNKVIVEAEVGQKGVWRAAESPVAQWAEQLPPEVQKQHMDEVKQSMRAIRYAYPYGKGPAGTGIFREIQIVESEEYSLGLAFPIKSEFGDPYPIKIGIHPDTTNFIAVLTLAEKMLQAVIDDLKVQEMEPYVIETNEEVLADHIQAQIAGFEWAATSVTMDDLNVDMFRDYDYRNTGPFLKPEMVFRFGLVWAEMALEKAKAAGIDTRDVLLARDARKIEPEMIDALVAALRYKGLNVKYMSKETTSAVTSYSWGVQETKPLMSIFMTASHVSKPKDVIVRGFKVAMLEKVGGTIQSMPSRAIKVESLNAIKPLIEHPEKIAEMKAETMGSFEGINLDENVIKFNALIGKVAAQGGSLFELSQALKQADQPLDIVNEKMTGLEEYQPLQGMKIVVEGSNTPSGHLTRKTFEALGATVISLNEEIHEIDGEHTADPSSDTNLIPLQNAVEEHGADFGMAFDLDGDRGAIVVPERSKDRATKFHNLLPDNLLVVLLPALIEKWGYGKSGKKIGTIRDVLGTHGVNDSADRLGIDMFQTDAGYVFLKAVKEKMEAEGYVFPVYGEKSGHTWLDISGEIENPLAVGVLFATLVREAKATFFDTKREEGSTENPVIDFYNERTIPYSQSPRIMPFFHTEFLEELSSDEENKTGWVYDKQNPTNPPQAVIGLGKHKVITALKEKFQPGTLFATPVGEIKVREFNTVQDAEEDGGKYRFADIVFEDQDGHFMGRFIFRASSNDPQFVSAYEAPYGEDTEEAAIEIRIAVAGTVISFLTEQKFAIVEKDVLLAEKAHIFPLQDGKPLADEEVIKSKYEKFNLSFVENDLRASQERMAVSLETAIEEASAQQVSDEKVEGIIVGQKLHDVLDADSDDADLFLKGGYEQLGYGVPAGAAIDGNFAIGDEGNQGYFVDKTADGRSGKEVFIDTVNDMKKFFARRQERLGKPIKLVIKTGIGGQHTPFQGIANVYQVIDPTTGYIVGEYELGKNFEESMNTILAQYNAGWDQVAVIPSSKSGSTDETMMVFVEILRVLLKKNAVNLGLNGKGFAKAVLDYLHSINFKNGREITGKDLFKNFNFDSMVDYINTADVSVTVDEAKEIFGIVLGNMFFETTDRPEASRLSAFIRNSGLDKVLGDDAPGFGAMFDNVGGRWTADLHMMTFLAYHHNMDAEAYWSERYEGVKAVRSHTHFGNKLGDYILDNKIKKIAFIVPDILFWYGKSIEQNFNESIWQEGCPNLRAIKTSMWSSQKHYYANQEDTLVINLWDMMKLDTDTFNVFNIKMFQLDNKQVLAHDLGRLATTFYGMTYTVGNRLIARALAKENLTAKDINVNDLNNRATQILQENLYLRQPYVELGKGLLESRIKELQRRQHTWKSYGRDTIGPIDSEKILMIQAANDRRSTTNIMELSTYLHYVAQGELATALQTAIEVAKKEKRTFVPFIYLEGEKFGALRDHLVDLGIEWVLQGTGDQHISWQQVLAQPQDYLPFVISFVPALDDIIPGVPAVGFAKGYLDGISSHMVRDYFAEASYRALAELREEEGGKGFFMRLLDTDAVRDEVADAFSTAVSAVTSSVSEDFIMKGPEAKAQFVQKRARGAYKPVGRDTFAVKYGDLLTEFLDEIVDEKIVGGGDFVLSEAPAIIISDEDYFGGYGVRDGDNVHIFYSPDMLMFIQRASKDLGLNLDYEYLFHELEGALFGKHSAAISQARIDERFSANYTWNEAAYNYFKDIHGLIATREEIADKGWLKFAVRAFINKNVAERLEGSYFVREVVRSLLLKSMDQREDIEAVAALLMERAVAVGMIAD